jgi:hypothetical protein
MLQPFDIEGQLGRSVQDLRRRGLGDLIDQQAHVLQPFDIEGQLGRSVQDLRRRGSVT